MLTFCACINVRYIWPCRSTTLDGVVWSVFCQSLCHRVTIVSPAKTAEPIEMPF